MSTHEHLVEQEEIMAYLDGELPVDQAAKAAAHLQECQECQQFAVELRSVSQAMTHWEIGPFDRELDSQMLAALEEREHPQLTATDVPRSARHGILHVGRWPRWGWMTAAASIAVLVIVGVNMPHMARMSTFDRLAVAEHGQARDTLPPLAAPQVTARIPEELRRREESQLASNLEVDSTKAGGVIGGVTVYPPPAPGAVPAKQDSSAAPNAPMIARTAELAITTKDFEAARARVDEILKRQGGYIGQMNVSSPSDAEHKLTAVLRVPADHLEAAIAELKKVGRVESESQAGEEVTSQYVDLQARLTNARNTEQRLTELLRTRTGKLEEVVAVEEKLSEVREQIERMEAEKKALTKRVDFGTLSLSLSEEHQAQMRMVPQSVGTQFRNSAVEGYRSVVDGVINVLLFLMSWGPSLLLWGAILFFPARYLWRKVRAHAAQ
jgi:anti-sigma factor RsiW